MNSFQVPERFVVRIQRFRLCNPNYFQMGKWSAGMYSVTKPQFDGQLDHFNSSLKTTEALELGIIFSWHIQK